MGLFCFFLFLNRLIICLGCIVVKMVFNKGFRVVEVEDWGGILIIRFVVYWVRV